MVKFAKNRALSKRARADGDTHNRAGGRAFRLGAKQELVQLVTTSLVSDSFHSSAAADLARLEKLVDRLAQSGEGAFAAKAAIYARKTHGLRSISHAVAGLLAPHASGQPWARPLFNKVVHRPDDLTEILGFYWSKWGTGSPVPNAMKRGFAQALQGFDGYQLAKYRGGSGSVRLVDAVNLCHPKSNESLDALMQGTLAPANTWEVALSEAGKSGEAGAKAAVWERLLNDGKLGYFAALRNARNIIEQAPDAVRPLVVLLTDRQAVKRSMVLPFQIAKAIQTVSRLNAPKAGKVVKALIKALDLSLSNVPKLDGSTLVALDTSGSMAGAPLEIGALFAAVLINSQDDIDLQVFSDDARYLAIGGGSVYRTAEAIKSKIRMAGTNFHSIFDRAQRRYDRVVILSDMQAWIGYHTPADAASRYRARHGAAPKVFTWDLRGHGTAQFPAESVYALSGWSDKVFDVMEALETQPKALIETVEAIDL